jgi:hypothetical protein
MYYLRRTVLVQPTRPTLLRVRRLALMTLNAHARVRVVLALLCAITLGACSLSLQAGASVPTPPVVSTPASFAGFDFSYVVRVLPPGGSRNVRVWIPLPSSGPYQTISQMQVKSPVRSQMHKERKYGNRYAYFDVDSTRVRAGFEIRVAFHVVRYERRLNLAAIDAPGPFPKDVAPFLQADGLAPTDGVIASVWRAQTEGLSDPIQKARRIYDYVISAMSQDPGGPVAGRRDALWAADSHRANGTDFDSLFIGMARAAGIPARFEIGFSLPEGQTEGIVPGYHSWSEFYVNGIGWVPVDGWGASQDPSKRDDFFGALDAHRVMFSTGRDILLTPAPQGGPLHYIAYPYIEADGRPSSVSSMDFFFNASEFLPPRTIFRKLIFARGGSLTPDLSS